MKHEELSKLQKQYDRLTTEEKLRRVEYLAQYYLGINTKDCKFVVDATKYWPQFEEMKRIDDIPDLNAVALSDIYQH